MQKRRRISTFYFQIVQRLCWSIVAVPLDALLIEFKSRLNVFWKLLPQIRNAADDVLFLIIIFYYYHFNWNGNNMQRYTKHNRKKILTMIELQQPKFTLTTY